MRLTSLFALVVFTLVGCAGAPTYNPSVFPFELDQELQAKSQIKTVVIPHVNLGVRSRSYLSKEEKRIDGYVAQYLKENGYKVLPQRDFKQHWNTAVRAFGDPSDPTTGKINMKTFSQIMVSVKGQMESAGLDAFVFTDLIELEVAFEIGQKHIARWDGVNRKPSLQGPGNSVSSGFDWYKPASVASMQVSIYNMDLQRVFVSRGGLDATDAINSRSSTGNFVRRRNLLENKVFIREGIELSFHPFINMEAWPGNP
jgi:hypothetical protein